MLLVVQGPVGVSQRGEAAPVQFCIALGCGRRIFAMMGNVSDIQHLKCMLQCLHACVYTLLGVISMLLQCLYSGPVGA